MMIVVVADDLTGAAELGGVGFRYGLRTEVQTEFNPHTDSDIVILDTNTRSFSADDASRCITEMLNGMREYQVFKKTDSVLRGPVQAELVATMNALGKHRVLLVPANPYLGRVIRDGHYYVNGCPIHQTDFAKDPEHPVRSSFVVDMLGASNSVPVQALSIDKPLPERGISIGEALSVEDLSNWAHCLDADTLAAGASEFFEAILKRMGLCISAKQDYLEFGCGSKSLFVCGSCSSYSRSMINAAEASGVALLRMPDELLASDAASSVLIEKWAFDVADALSNHSIAIAAIDRPVANVPGLPQRLSHYQADMVASLLDKMPISNIYAEGGATASALVRRLGWKQLQICDEASLGVVRMRTDDSRAPFLMIKPGSYKWPESVPVLGSIKLV